MSTKRKGLRYTQKHLDYKREDSATLRMKVLRSVLAVGVGFAMTPWLGRGAYAEGTGNIVRSGTGQANMIVDNVANIHAAQAANGVGLNAFEHFTLGNNDIANLYFETKPTDESPVIKVNTLVNTVQNRISIDGTVNAIRNGKIGGNLYFLSPQGMVVGSSGVINAGSLTVMTSGLTFANAQFAAQAVSDKVFGDLDSKASIDIHGKINAATGIDLRAAYINVTKASGSNIAPALKTGVVFKETVNTKDINQQAGNVVSGSRLSASLDDEGNIVIFDPSNPTGARGEAAVKGDGSIKLAAYSDSRNTNTSFLGVTSFKNTVESKVEVGNGASIDALGNVDISATASITAKTKILHFVDLSGYAKASVNIDGAVTGNKVNISSSAKANYSGGNFANLLDIINDGTEQGSTTIKSNLTNLIWGKLEKAGKVSGTANLVNNIVNQLYMPFNLCDAEATTTIGSNANIQAKTLSANNKTVGGDVNISAASAATNKMKVGLAPKVNKGDQDFSRYFTGGFIYEDSTSKATVNVDGIVHADNNLSVKAKAENENSSSLAVKAPKVYKVPNPGPNDPYDSPMVAVGVGIAYQDTTAEVNIGKNNAAADLSAGKKLSIEAASDNTMSSDVSVELKSDTAFNVAVNVVGSEGTATVNNYGHLSGKTVNIASEHTLSEFSVSTSNDIVGEYTGLDWLLDSKFVRSQADNISDFVKSFSNGSQQAAGNNVQAPAQGGGQASAPAWNDYFDIGASVTVASSENNAKINLKPTSSITASGDVAVNANIDIADSNIVTGNVFVNTEKATTAVVSAAVAVENMHNTSEVNLESDNTGHTSINAGGAVEVTATAEQRYNRAKQLVQDLKDAVKAFKEYWTKEWGTQKDLNKKLGNLQNIIVDMDTLLEKDDAANFKESDKFVGKAKAGLDIITSLTGTEGIKKALEAFFDVSNYVNMHVSTGVSNDAEKVDQDITAVITGSVGVQNLHNTANVNIGAGSLIKAGESDLVTINADVVESNVLLVGKMALLPDVESIADAKAGVGGSVGVQNSYSNSKVNIMNNVKIDAGAIAIGTKNDVMNIGVVFGGSQTSKLGITGMVSYMGGDSHAETLIDDDVEFIARKKIEKVKEKDKDDKEVEVDKVTSSGAVDISSTNKTIVVDVVGDWNSSEASSVGVSTGVVSYDVNSIAEVTNQELNADGSSAETSVTANHKGSISANSVNVSALTDGVINNLTIAGVNSSKSQNSNAAAGGVNVAAAGGQAANGVQNAQINGGNAGGQDANVKINAVGSVSWNYVVDETKATLDNVEITLTPPEKGDRVTSTDITGSVRVEAEDASYIGAYSGAMALTKLGNNNTSGFQGSLAGAVAVNDLKKTTTSTLKNSDIARPSNADVGVDVLNYAHNSGAQVAAGLSLGLEVGKRPGNKVPIEINLAASGSANYVDSTVHADMLSNTVQGGNSTVVNNIAYDKDVQVAGGVTVEFASGTASVGAAVTVNDVKNDIKAAMNNNNIGAATLFAKEVHNVAASNLTQVGTAVSVGVVTGDKSYADLNVAVARNKINNTVNASTDGGIIYADKFSDEAKDGKVSLDEENNKYLTELNTQTSNVVTVDANGNFVQGNETLQRSITLGNDGYYYKDGVKLTPSVELREDGYYYSGNDRLTQAIELREDGYYYQFGEKLTPSITQDAQGNYFDIDGNPITYNPEDGLYYNNKDQAVNVDNIKYYNSKHEVVDINDANYYNSNHEVVDVINVVYTDPSGNIVDINDVQYRNASGAVVDINAVKTEKKTYFDLYGSEALKNANGANGVDLDVTVADNADKATYNSSKITLSNKGNTIVGVALGLGVKAGDNGQVQGAGAVAVNTNTVTNDFMATVKNATIATSTSTYEANGDIKDAALKIEAESDTSMVSVAAGVAVAAGSDNTASLSLAGSGAVQNITNTTKATIEKASVTTDYLAVKGTTKSTLVSVAGQVSVETGKKGVSAGLTWAENTMHNTTGAYAKGITLNGINNAATNLDVYAENKSKDWSVAVGAGVALGFASAEGAYAANRGKNDTEALVEKYELKNDAGVVTESRDNILNNVKLVAVNAKDNSVEKAIAGSVSVSLGYATLGGAAAYNNIGNSESDKQKVKAKLADAVITTANNAKLQALATNEADFFNLALGGAVRAAGSGNFGLSAEGDVAVATLYTSTEAELNKVNVTPVNADSKALVEVNATTDTDVTTSADAISVSAAGGGPELAFSATVSKVKSDADTTATINASNINAKDVLAKANSSSKLLDIALGLSVGVGKAAGVALAGNIASNKIDNDTNVNITGSTIVADGTVAALVDSYEKLANYGGALSVGVGSEGAGVAFGTTVVTNSITGDSKATVTNSNLTAYGRNAATNGIELENYVVGEDGTVTTSKEKKAGVVVNADAKHVLRDISITGGVGASGTFGGALDITAVMNNLEGDTKAEVIDSNINKGITSGLGDVSVRAHDKMDVSSHVGTLSAGVGATGGVGLAGSGDSNILNRDTYARIVGQVNSGTRSTLNAHNADVYALGETKVHVSETGVAVAAGSEGAGSGNASVSLDKFTGNTLALVSNVEGQVHKLSIDAERAANVRTYNNAITLSGAYVSGSIGVAVTDVEDISHTNADLSNSIISSDGEASNAVEVLANNNTHLETEISSDSLAISLGFAVGVGVENVNMDAQVGATVNNSNIGNESQEFSRLDVKANNKLYNKFQNVDVAAASILGVGVGKGVLNMNGQTTANVSGSSAFAKDINVWAHETRKTDEKMVGVGVGIVSVGVNLLYTNVGGNLENSYDYDRGDGSTSSYSTSDIQNYVNNAISKINASVDRINRDTHTSGTAASTQMSSINKGSAAGKVETKIDNSALTASSAMDVKAQATTNLNNSVEQGQVAGVAVAVVASHVDVKDNLNVNIKNSAVQADVIRVNSKTDGTIENYVGQGGFTVGAYADTTAYVKHHGDNTIAIDHTTLQALGAVVNKVAPLNILASNNTKIDNSGVGVNISGLTAGRLVLKGEDKTNVAINLGKNEDISGSNLLQGNGIYVEAKNAPEVKDEIEASVSVGGFEFHGSIVESHATGTASLNATNKNSFDSGDVSLLAQTGGAQGYTTEALNHAVSVTGLDITVNKARTYNNMEAKTNLGAAAFSNGLTFGNLTIGSINNTDSNAYVHTVNIGVGFACSSSLAQSYANGKAITTLDTGNSTLRVNNLDIYATNSDEIETKADGSNGGLIVVAPYAAQVENTVNTTTTTTIKGNIVAEGTVTAQALRKDLENLRADSLTVTAIGGGDVKTFSNITANTTLNLDEANISSGKDMLLEAENTVTMNRAEGFEKMVMGQGWGAVGIDTSGIVNTINSNAHINLKDTELVSAGDIKLLSHTMENMQVNGYIYNVSAVGGSETRVTNNITNDEQVKLTNSKIKAAGVGKNITISAADDIKLFTFAYSETGTGVVTGSNAIMHNNITRNNKIKLEGSGNQLYSMQDINLYAGKLADGNVATLDLDAEAADFSGAVIAIAVEPTVDNDIKQNNQITIDAGSSSTSVRHTNLYAAQGREMARVYAGRYSGMWGSERKGSFVTTDKGQTVNGKTDQNYVKIDGNVVAGVANKLNITIGNINEVVILDDAERGIASVPDLYNIVATPTLNLDVSEGSGITASSITYGSEDYANVLLARYLQLEALITEYSKDSTPTALAGYQAEAQRIKNTMVDMGLATVDTSGKLTMQNSCRVDYVEIPDLVASGGNITIDTSDFGGSGKVAAQGTPSINIVNNTNMLLKVNEVIMDDPGGMLIYNGSALTPTGSDAAAVTASLNSKINALNKKNSGSAQAGFNTAVASEGSTGSITITGKNSLQQITYNGTITNPLDTTKSITFENYVVKPLANVQIQGNIINKHGNVNITSLNNDILIQGKTAIDNVAVSGANVTLTANAGSITQGYTDGIVSIGGSVQEYYNDYYKTLPNVEKVENIGVAETLPAEGSKGSGSYIAGGSVYINAADININGVIQSGYGYYVLNIDSSVQAAITNITNAYDGSREISDAVVTAGDNYKIVDGGPVWNEAKGCYEYQLSAYYNPSTKKIIVEDVDANGGKIYLTGRISSTGAGKIVCLDGVSSIDITNQLNYTTELGQLKTNEVAGMVQITDTAGYKVGTTPVNKVTTITNGKAEVKYVDANGATVPSENDVEYVFFDSYEDVAEDLYKYNPKVGLAYQWTSGKNVSDYTRYTWHQQKALWGAWYPSASIEDLTRWEQELPYVPVTTGSIDRNKGETIVDTGLSNFTSSMTHTTNTYSSALTKEQEKYYSTGLWGYYKHYEVTWTRSNGTTHTYNAQIKADNPIDVQFIGSSAANAHVNVDTVANVELTGNVGNTKLYESADGSSHDLKGSINIHSQNGSLIQTGGSLYGSDIELVAGKDMQNISVTAGDTVNLSAVNAMSNQSLLGQNTIDVTVNAAYLAKGNVILGNMGSALPIKDGDGKVIGYNPLTGSTGITGIVNLNVTGSEGNISQKDGNVCIVSDRINLTSSNGAIYGQKSVDEQGNVSYTALKLYAGQQPMGLDTLDASVNASAKGDIYLEQTAGNMRIGTIYSTDGDVSLKVTNGSVEDALPYVSNDRGDADDMLARWKNLGIIAGDADAVDAKVKTDDLASYNETRFQEYLNLKALSERTEEQQVQYEAYEAEYAPYLKADGSLDAVAYNKDSQWNQYQNSVKFEFAQYQELKGKADRTEAETKQLESLTQKYGEYADFDAYLASEQVQKRKDAIYSENYGTYNTWDPYALLYAIQDSLVNPDSSALSTSDKAPNIIGHNITINVSDSVGMNSGETKRINVDTLLDKDGVNYAHLDDLKALSKLDASTKISWETGDDGYRYAVYTETIPIGIQQTTKTVVTEQGITVVNGTLTVQSEASNPSTGTSSLHGDIFLQGREQKLSTNGESTPITQNKDLFVNNILTNIGEVTLTSLGNILNAANAGSPAITGKNLVLNAHGTIGTATNRLTTNLFGSDNTLDGLSAIATGGIYVDQKGTSDLIVCNISSGGDIYLGSDKSIIMGVVNGTDAKNYIRAENNGDIVLEARDGSIGEVEYEKDAQGNYVLDAQGNKIVARDTNNGVRILNAANKSTAETQNSITNVTLRASDSVYVTGVASDNGQSAAPQGPAGWLNLTVESTNVDAQNQTVPLNNVGIYVDGQLNLENAVNTSETASIYLTDDFTMNDVARSITSADVFVGSAKALTVDGQGITGTDKVTLQAVKSLILDSGNISSSGKVLLDSNENILLQGGSLNTANLDMIAVGYVDETYDNNVDTANGYTLSVSDTLQVLTSGKNDADGKEYGIDLGSKFNKLHKVVLSTENGNVIVGNGNNGDITLDVIIDKDINTLSGNIDIHNYNNLAEGEQGNDITVSGLLKANGIVNIINDESDIKVLESADAEINGSEVKLQAAGSIENENNIISGSFVDMQAHKCIVNSGNITAATDITMLSETDSILNLGDVNAQGKVNATARGGSIINLSGEIKAVGDVRLNAGDTLWNLAGVTSTGGNVILEANNRVSNTTEYGTATGKGVITAAGDVTISTNDDASTAANLGVYNDADIEAGGAVTIHSNKDLENIGKIVAAGTATGMTSGNVTMTAKNDIKQSDGDIIGKTITVTADHDVQQSNGKLWAKGTGTDDAILITAGNDITLKDGSMVAKTASLTATAGSMTQITAEDMTGHAVEAESLTVKAGQGVSLGSKENKLEQVYLDVAGGQEVGGILIGNGNTGDTELHIAIKADAELADNITIHNYNNLAAGEHGNDIVVDGTLQTSGNITLINDESDIEVRGSNKVIGKNVNFNAAGSIYNEHSIEAQEAATMTANQNIYNFAGEIKAKNQVSLSADDILWNLASITSETSNVQLTAGQAVLNTTSSSDEKPEDAPPNAAGFINAAQGSVTISTTKALAEDVLGGVYNNATITALNSVTINSNDDAYNTGSITVANNGLVTIKATSNVYINDGNVSANNGTIKVNAGHDIQQNNGSLGTESGVVNLTAGQNIILNDGYLTASNASLTATNGHIEQNYDNANADAGRYDIKIINDLTLAAGNNGTDAVATAIDLGSKFNELKNVVLRATNGNIFVGSGRSTNGALSITVDNEQIVKGNILFHNFSNFSNGVGNDIKLNGNLKAMGDINIINDEQDIIIQSNNAPVVEATNVNLEAKRAIQNQATIKSSQNTVLYAHGVGLSNNVNAIDNSGNITAAGEIYHSTDAGDIYNTGSMDGAKGVYMVTNKNNDATTGNIVNHGSILTDRNAVIDSWGNLTNTGNIQAGGFVDLDASGDVVNGVTTDVIGTIKAGGDVYLTSWKGNVTNYDNIESTNGRVVLENGYVYTLDNNNNTTLVNDILNTGRIWAKEDVTIRTYNGSINNENVITSQTGSVTIEALRSEHYQPTTGSTAVVGVIRNTGTNDATNNADILAAQNITMNAAASIINIGDFIVNEGNIQVNANDTILNLGNYNIEEDGNISVISNNGDVLNVGKYYTESGNIHMEANDDLINLGVMETEAGNINLSSLNGSLYNEAGADLLTGDGNITLAAKSAMAGYYYTVYNEATRDFEDKLVDTSVTSIYTYTIADDPDKVGGQYILLTDGSKQDVVKNGSVFNAGDAMAINGTITMTSAHGDVTNYDDFNTLVGNGLTEPSKVYTTVNNPNGISIATGNVAIIAENGTLYNTKDLESGENITLTAANGLTNFAYNVYAGKDITLTATNGNVENTSVLESIYGDVTLIAQNGSVINGLESARASGDIITLGGTVKLQATSDVKNYGDIIAIGKTTGDVAGSGSIVLKSEQGSVYNFDDFNTLDNGSEINYAYEAGKHLSVAGRPAAGTSYNIATSNITLSAVNGTIFNNKDYLVALGDVTLEAQHGIGSYGDVILAGGNITMSDTDGDLINQANLVSLSGDITLNASKGTVVNMTRGEVVALDGNVVLNAGDSIDADHRIYLIDDLGNKTTLNTTGVDVGDRIIITENYYLKDNNVKVFLSNTLLDAPSGKSVYTQVSFINDNEERVLIRDGIAGRREAFRAGDVVNRGDIVAQNTGSKDLTQAGNVQLNSAHGNVANYDDYKLVDAQKDSANRGFYDYLGENGYSTGDGLTVKFNANLGDAYNANKRYILSDSGMELKAPEGYLYNDLALKSHQDITLESGKTLTVGTNFASIEADGDVVIRSTQGNVYNNSSVVSTTGSIVLDGFNGVESQVGAENLQALNGSISAVSIYGDVNIDELIAGEMAAAGSQQGNVVVGSLEGKDVVLYTESADATISVGKGIKVDEYLLLQGNYLDLPTIQRTNTDGTLIVDVSGVSASGGSAAMKSDLNLTIDGDVRFTTMNVTNAKVEVGGKLSVDKLHVDSAAHFTSFDFVTGVYGGGTAPKHDSSNALYYDLGDGTGSGYNMRLSAEEFRAIKEGTPETVRALATMKSLKERLAQVAATPGTFNTDNSGWMNLYVDKSNYQRSNGLLLHIDTGYRSANQRWSAEDLSTKLVDFTAHEAFTANYGDVTNTFGRYDLVEVSAKPMGEILHAANENKVVLQKDNSSLRIEEKREEKE